MSTKDLAHGVAEVRRVMERVDTNGDGVIDFGEFCALARANSDLELVLHSLTVEEPRVCFGVFFPHMHQAQRPLILQQRADVCRRRPVEAGDCAVGGGPDGCVWRARH
jgi:hypothetical protein